MILRGIKTAELRSRSTTIIGERFYIYAAKAKAIPPVPIWSDDLRVAPPGAPPQWMIELAEQVKLIEDLRSATGALLPTGVIVGSAIIEKVTRNDDLFEWHLAGVERAKRLRKPKGIRSRCGSGRSDRGAIPSSCPAALIRFIIGECRKNRKNHGRRGSARRPTPSRRRSSNR